MSTDTAPDDNADAGLEAGSGGISDEEWLAGHRALAATGAIPESELAYLFDPARDPADVDPAELTPGPDPKEPGRG